jgi:hypothetical protein
MRLFNEGKRHVDSGGDPRAGRNAPIAHEEHRLLDHGMWITTSKEGHCLPVCCTAPAIQQACLTQCKRPGAD